jgi:hypothetical protein
MLGCLPDYFSLIIHWGSFRYLITFYAVRHFNKKKSLVFFQHSPFLNSEKPQTNNMDVYIIFWVNK